MTTSMENLFTNNNISISNSIILNNYSIQNVFISPSYIESSDKISEHSNCYKQENDSEFSYTSIPKKLFIKKIEPINFERTKFLNKLKNINTKMINKNKGNSNILNFNNSQNIKNSIKIIPKIISITKVDIQEEKFPHDSSNKKKIKNKFINNKDDDKNLLKNSKYHKIFDIIGKKEINLLGTNYKESGTRISLTKKEILPLNSEDIKEKPKENFNLKEFIFAEKIGEGTFGEIFCVNWIKNNKSYAMKKEKLNKKEDIEKRIKTFKIVKNFIKETGCKGVVNLYGNLSLKKCRNITDINTNIKENHNKEYIYYELMEKAQWDWDKEINIKSEIKQYYLESEIINIMTQLIGTLSILQKNHITHRDIKPQNILIFNGRYKLCDFGEIRVLKRDGLIVQRIRGSELYMSPILFHGLHLNLIQVKHDTYKSDVFSLGMCLFYALTLTYRGVNSIREIIDMKKIKEILFQYLSKRYSTKLIMFILSMLEVDENKRPNFINLEEKLKKTLL